MAKQQQSKVFCWDVTMRGAWFKGGQKTFRGIKASTNQEAKMVIIMQEFGSPFTALMDQMTARRCN